MMNYGGFTARGTLDLFGVRKRKHRQAGMDQNDDVWKSGFSVLGITAPTN